MEIITLQQSEALTLQLPQWFVDKHNLKPGDEVSISLQEDGSLLISPFEEISLELSDEAFLKIARVAHIRNITINQCINEMLEEAIREENLQELANQAQELKMGYENPQEG